MPPRQKQWGGNDNWDEDQLSVAVTQAVEPILPQETEWDQAKLEKRVRQYFKNAAKGLEFYAKPWQELVEEFADLVFASLFQALKDRAWLSQVDFLMVLDAAIKELFPPDLFTHVPQNIFERQVLQAHDRAFEEQRFSPMLWDTLFERIPDKASKNRVYNAFEAGRKEAAQASSGDGPNPVEDFVHAWISCSLGLLQDDSPGLQLEQLLSPTLCAEIFHALTEAGALPLPLTSEGGPPPAGWPFIDSVVEDVYAGRIQRPQVSRKGVSPQASASSGLKGGVKQQAWTAPPAAKGWGGAKGTPKGCSGKAYWNQGAQKRPADESWGGKNGGCKGGAPAQKWQRQAAVPQPAPKRGHPQCTQQEDCIGSPQSALVQHVDDDAPGDIYCCNCWAVFADADESLNAVPYEG
eukprot:gb/GFBE01046479.1/.p1 GENE.gb/GFBE01046479.1/~~gb/GFBE01046479.1/.p1  ORF type:complete len:407 (+),score=67.90 gb/GFBE01046479.1/:1-1221(+)